MARAALRGFVVGAGIGGGFGVLFGLVGLFEEQGAGLALALYGLAIGGAAGAVAWTGAFLAARERLPTRRRR